MWFGSPFLLGSLPRCYGLLAAVLALVSQLALGAMVLPDAAAPGGRAALDAVAVLCVGGAPAVPGRPAPHRHHASEAALCPLSIGLALPAVLITPQAALPAPSAGTAERMAVLLSPRGPPHPAARVGLPRGPPDLA